MSNKIIGNASGNIAEVDAQGNLMVNAPGNKSDGTTRGGGNANAPATLMENDPGVITGSRYVKSPEVDSDFKLRINAETILDDEVFNYAQQNTGKHAATVTAMTQSWLTSGYQTNSSSIVTSGANAHWNTYAFFPIFGAGQITYVQIQAAFLNQPSSNQTIEFGLGFPSGSALTDGVYFRQDAAGVKGVVSNSGVEIETLLNFAYTNNSAHRYVIAASQSFVEFWIDDILYARVITPIGQGQPTQAAQLPFSVTHRLSGTAGSVQQLLLKNYSVSIGGSVFTEQLGSRTNAIIGSYQAFSGNTVPGMGGFTVYPNSTNPTAAVPINAGLSANLPSGLGGQAWETFSLAVNTDAILMSYQLPSSTLGVIKRLKVTGVKMSAFVQTVLVGGPAVSVFTLAFGHTGTSLATGELSNAKKPRIVLLPELTQAITAAQAVGTMISQPGGMVSMFPEPIYVNPGEFIAFAVKHIGTVGTSGTIAYNIQYVYSWE